MGKDSRVLCYVSNTYPCKTGGMEIYNYYLIKELDKTPASRSITILASCRKLREEVKNALPERNRLFGLRRYGLGVASTVLYYCFSNKIRWRDVRTIYLPYTSNFSYNAFAFLILKAILNVDYVVHIHSGGRRESKPQWLLKSFFKNAQAIAGVSYPIVEEYAKKTGRKVQYLPPLLPFRRSTESKESLKKNMGLDMFKRIILFVGSIKELKSPETLLKAYVGLGEDFIAREKIGLIMVGDGSLRNGLENKYSNITSIVFRGAVPYENINEYYRLADVYTITSWFEGTSISLLEALFNRLPCIGTNVTGIREIIEHRSNGYLFEKDDYRELSMIMKEIIANYASAKIVGENAYKYYQNKFSYKGHLSDVMKFIGA